MAAALAISAAVAVSAGPASAARPRPVPAGQSVAVTIRLPLRDRAGLERLVEAQSDPHSPMYRHFLSPAQFRANYGPSQNDLRRVALEMHSLGFTVDHLTSQGVALRAPDSIVERAFGARLGAERQSNGHMLVRSMTRPRLSADLAAMGAVVSTDGIRLERRSQMFMAASKPVRRPQNFLSPVGPYFTSDLKQAYAYPSDAHLDGRGTNIGIVIDSFVDKNDISDFLQYQGITLPPKIKDEKIDGGQYYGPADPNNPDVFEATLDVEQSIGMANNTNVTVYDMPDLSDQSIGDAYQQIVDDNKVDIVNSSFGGCEKFYTAAYNDGTDYTFLLQYQHDVFLQGNAQGITFVASSGDQGELGCVDAATFTHFVPGVISPADDPNVTSVGGSNLETTANDPNSSNPLQSKYVAENAHGDPTVPYDYTGATDENGNPILTRNGIFGSGGGASLVFPIPNYAKGFTTKAFGRAVPDVSGHMGGCPAISNYPIDPSTGYAACPAFRSADLLAYQGYFYGVVGTSASSPDFAGLLALTEQFYGTRVGSLNPYLYLESYGQQHGDLPLQAFRTGITGYNGLQSYAQPYDEVTGLGSVIGLGLGQLTTIPVSFDPGTVSNP